MATQRVVPFFPEDPAPLPAQVSVSIYRPGLDALRFFAFFAVLLHHSIRISSHGYIAHHPLLLGILQVMQKACGFGLCLFFFLSSYLITSLLGVEKARTGTIGLRKFYLRRALRIWPLYFLFLTAMFLLGLAWKEESIEPARLAAFFLLAGNWYALLYGWGASTVLHLWSISIEEQYYLVWPWVSRTLSTGGLRRLCVALCLLCLTVTWVLAATGSSSRAIWLNSAVQSVFFAAGGLLALQIGLREQTKSLGRSALMILGGLALWMLAEWVGRLTDQLTPSGAFSVVFAYAATAVGCALLLLGFLRLPHRLLVKPLLYLGRISYGLYVYHFLVLIVVRQWLEAYLRTFELIGITLVLTTVIAALSYEWIEKPFLKLKSRFEFVHTRAA